MTLRQDDPDGPSVIFVERVLLIIGLLLGFGFGICIGAMIWS